MNATPANLSLELGLGEAVERMMHLFLVMRSISGSEKSHPELHEEYDMLKAWLDASLQLDSPLVCSVDEAGEEALPNNVTAFSHSVKTACCRLPDPPKRSSRGKRRTRSR